MHARENVSIIAEDSATVHAYGRAYVRARGHSQAYAHEESIVDLEDGAVAYIDSDDVEVLARGTPAPTSLRMGNRGQKPVLKPPTTPRSPVTRQPSPIDTTYPVKESSHEEPVRVHDQLHRRHP